MMTTLTRYMKKTTAIAMAAMVLSLPLASVASAHERHDAPPPRHSDRYDRHYRYHKHHKNDNYVTKKDSNKKSYHQLHHRCCIGCGNCQKHLINILLFILITHTQKELQFHTTQGSATAALSIFTILYVTEESVL